MRVVGDCQGEWVSRSIENPILNSPYEQPDRPYEVGPKGPTGVVLDGRRPSESFIPIAITKKGKGGPVQTELDFGTGDRRERNTLINDLRRDVEPVAARRPLSGSHTNQPQTLAVLGRR